ncbi:AMP-binding protein [Streptomyces sp. MZ04]|uniref:(2,3-dihydroxybenzoyl)adenylate synthase n=1 Tax=Streptomyces sp. MZ04 TaxID=2559236 RepID=UPI00107E9B0F|nr:AMP-binding protein [Streptomyces sp. MZ04]TGB15115.1 2,3-dihydroxybenzoate-AMP ligase [Streptomyces sp. MZ04]
MLDGCTPWPAEFQARYRSLGCWRGESLGSLPRTWARAYGSRTALVHGEQRISYARLAGLVDRMAAGFRARGLRAGERVIVQLPNIPEFVIVCFALFRLDVKPVFSLLAHRADEIRHLAALSGAVGYVVPGAYRGFDFTALAGRIATDAEALRLVCVADGKLPDAVGGSGAESVALADVDADPVELPEPDASDVAFFLLSGGTTALPKLIPRTHDDYAYQTRVTAGINCLTADDVYLAALPVEFNFSWGCPGVVGTLSNGGTVVLADGPDPADCFELIEREAVTFTSLVPTAAQLWVEAADAVPYQAHSLELIQIGGAPLHRELAEQILPVFGARLQQVFGMAEGLLTFTRADDPPETILTTQGRPVSPYDEIRIVDEDGAQVPVGTAGELLTRGPYTLRGYYRAAEHNARAFTVDGFYRTGDLARLTGTGDLVITGRIKDVIIRGGHKISATELEHHLHALPAVERVAVVPAPDPYLGERICLYVRPAGDPPTLAELRRALHELGLADYKLPDRLEIVSELPLTGLGKVDKKALSQAAAATA